MKKHVTKKFLSALLTVVMLLSVVPLGVITVSAYSPRTTAPSTSNAYYYSNNIFYTSGYGMPNCTCYAYGRAYELLGSKPKLSTGNAGAWWKHNVDNGYYPYGSTPKLGAVAVWDKYDDNQGHVAVVEAINGSQVTISESHYKGTFFNTRTMNSNSSDYLTNYRFRGYIYILEAPAPQYAPTWATITLNGECFTQGESITFTLNSDYATNYTIGIDRYSENGVWLERVLTESITSGYSISSLPVGYYSAYVTAYNNSGGLDSNRVSFIVDPVGHYTYLGNWFQGKILQKSHWKCLRNDNNENVCIYDEGGHSDELWRFNLEEDGTYTIRSEKDGKALQVYQGSDSNGANVNVGDYTGDASQRWYIYEATNGYYLRAKCTAKVLDLYSNDPSNGTNIQTYSFHRGESQVFAIYRGNDVLLCAPILSVQTIDNNLCLAWNDVPSRSSYRVRIWENKKNMDEIVVDEWNVNSTKYFIDLPVGSYEAEVHAYTWWGGYDSNLVSFNINHSWNTDYTIDKQPTCTEKGSKSIHCKDCLEKKNVTEIPATGHSFGSWTTTKAATCTADGTQTRTCSACNHSETKTIAKTGHTVVTDPAVAATCTTTGKTAGSHCSKCNAVITAQQTVPALGHNFGSWTVKTPATATKEGVEERTCHCGAKETRAIPKLGSDKVVSVKLNNKNVDTNYNRSFTLTPSVEVVGKPNYKVSYSSSNTGIATVDANGNVNTVGKGLATITVTVTDSNGNQFKDTCNVKVTFTFAQWLLYIICFGWIWM